MRYCAFAPLINFISDMAEIEVADNLVIAKATGQERALVERSHTYHGSFRFGGLSWSFVARSTLHVSKDKILDPHELFGDSFLLPSVFGLGSTLRVFKEGLVGLGPDYVVQKRPFKSLIRGSGGMGYIFARAGEKEYVLTREELSDFRSLHKKLFNTSGRKYARLNRALWRFSMSYQTGLLHQIVDLMTGLESLYLAEEMELAYKIAMRAAFLLGRTPEEKCAIYKTVKRAYTYRSTIVHGGDPLKSQLTVEDFRQTIYTTRDILRQSIKKFLDLLPCYDHKTLLEVTLDDNILTGGSLSNLQIPQPRKPQGSLRGKNQNEKVKQSSRR